MSYTRKVHVKKGRFGKDASEGASNGRTRGHGSNTNGIGIEVI